MHHTAYAYSPNGRKQDKKEPKMATKDMDMKIFGPLTFPLIHFRER